MFESGCHCLWEPLPLAKASTSLSSAAMPAAFGWSCLIDPTMPRRPGSIDLDPARNRTGDVWHVWVEGIRPGQLYAYRVDGPYQPEEGHRFNFDKLLLDPFATAISPLPDWDFDPARGYDPAAPERDLVRSKVDDAGAMPKCVFTHEHFHWHDDRPPRHPWSKTVIYETHVRGFTIRPNSGVEHPGTYRGLMEKIPYLKELGDNGGGTDAGIRVQRVPDCPASIRKPASH